MTELKRDSIRQKMAALLDAELMERGRIRYETNHVSQSSEQCDADKTVKEMSSSHNITNLLRTDVIRLASQALEMQEERLDPQENLANFGMDSIAITEVMVQISRFFGISIAPTTFFEAKHLDHLSEILAERYSEGITKHYQTQLSNKDGTERADEMPASWLKRHKKLGATLINVKPVNLSKQDKKQHKYDSEEFQQQKNNQQLNGVANEPVAIIAMEGMFPKSADIETLLANLLAGEDCIEEVPSSRWDWRKVEGDPKKGAFTRVRHGGFVPDHDLFDASFFNISPREAELIDPQHRLFMMSVWRLIEKAGYASSSLSGKKISIFLGINLLDHVDAVNQAGIMEAQQMTGLGHAFCPNRLSFMLDIHGPSEVVDTACSSSLVALHRAVMSIRHEGCEMAIAGGSNLMLSPKQHILFSKTSMLAADGRSKTFSKEADGYGRSDGVGAILLKPLSKAEQDGDQILGLITGSAEQHSGQGSSLTAPNSTAQARMIVEAHRQANVDPRAIGYVECHGTGTPLGDPAEVEGLKLAFAERFKDVGLEPPKSARIGLGSIKSNIGHTETTAGIAGLIKLLLSLQQKKLFKTLHCEQVNPLLNLEESTFYLLQEGSDWITPEIDGKSVPRSACISSFGAGGGNAHVVIEEYCPKQKDVANPLWSDAPTVIPISAKNETALKKIVEKLLLVASDYNFTDLVFTLQVGRDSMRERVAFIASNTDELKQALSDYLLSKENSSFFRGTAVRSSDDYVNPLEGSTQNIAVSWTNGAKVDWPKYYINNQPRRLHLPLYPYALKRFSLPNPSRNTQIIEAKDAKLVVKPLTPKAVSETRFELELTGTEFFLTDHVIMGQQILPGVAYLEMVQQASFLLVKDAVILKKIVWLKPLVIENKTLVSIVFSAQGDGHWLARIYAENNSNGPVEYAQIKVMKTEVVDTSSIDLSTLKTQADNNFDAEDIYQIFDEMELSYGPAHRAIREIKCIEDASGTRHVIGRLQLPDCQAESLESFALHPCLMDGAFQTVVGMGLSSTSQPKETALPFAIDSVEYIKPLQGELWVHVRPTGAANSDNQVQRTDIDLIADDGSICVRMKGFTVRLMKSPQSSKQETHIFKPYWSKVIGTNSPRSFEERHLIAFSPYISELRRSTHENNFIYHDVGAIQADKLANMFKSISSQILDIVQELTRTPNYKSQLLQLILPDDTSLIPLTGIVGMLRTIRKECPKIATQLISISGEVRKDILNVLNLASEVTEASWLRLSEQGDLEQYQWGLSETHQPSISFKITDDKVYLITGGNGGIAKQLTRYILDNAPKAHIVLTSRSALQLEHVTWLNETERKQVQHICADITQKKSVADLIDTIKNKHQQIHGVFHTAGVVDDGVLATKTTESLLAVLGPKVDGIMYLDQELGSEKLDFMVLFSSVACALGNPGQIDYAAANGFLDGFAQMREIHRRQNHCHGKTISIAWSLWRDGGMQLSQDAIEGMTRTTGLTLLNSDVAITTMMELLAHEGSHALVAVGDSEKIAAFVMAGDRDRQSNAQTKTTGQFPTNHSNAMQKGVGNLSVVLMQALKIIVSDELKVPTEELDTDEQLSEYGFDSIGFAQLANGINEYFNLDIIPILFFECPTLNDLCKHFIENYANEINNKLAVSMLGSTMKQEQGVNSGLKAPTAKVTNNALPIEKLKTNYGDDDPVVIIGMSCQYPDADNVEEYWQNLLDNVDAISEIPAERWDWRDYWGDPQKEPGRTNIKWGGFIKNAGAFDPDFFGISRPEARLIDPQQRLLLHQAWRLFENAGYAPKSFSGSDMGVFLGIADSAYSNIVAKDVEQIEGYTMAGLAPSLGPNRISYFYNLHGPSVAVETACSSALIAVHRAVEAIEAGRCSSAITGGINLLLNPSTYIGFSKAGMLAEDGRCKTFSAAANGYARGEGLGLILLKRLSEAERDGDEILAIVRASGENHGGFATSLTAPNPKAQADLLRDVYRRSHIDPRTVSYIEAHGTGTPMGDPIEVEALTAAFKDLHREAELRFDDSMQTSACGLGSVKSNIGHLEIAAGIAGLMKVVLQMRAGILVKSLHTETLNPYLKLDKGNFFVVDRNQSWQRVIDSKGVAQPFRAGVSSFGFGGSNSHVVLEEYIPPDYPIDKESESLGNYLIPISARTEGQLKEWLISLKGHLCSTDDSLSDIAYTLQVARDGMEHRIAVFSHSKTDLVEKLLAYLDGQNSPDLYEGRVKGNHETIDLLRNDDNFRNAAEQSIASGNYQTVASLWVRGFEVDWQIFNQKRTYRKVVLPGYPFDTSCYWGTAQTTSLSSQKSDAIEQGPKDVIERQPQTHIVSNNEDELTQATSEQILSKLTDLAALVLEVEVSALDVHAELGEFGFDSIVMTAFAAQVNEALDLDLSPADFFEFSTLVQLAEHIATTTNIKMVTETFDAKQQDRAAALNVEKRLIHYPDPDEDPVVIVGYSCNFPGARDAEQFWENLKTGTESVSRIPEERWAWQAVDGNPNTETGKTNVHWGGFCDGILEFDPAFFNISPREAMLMDPQQRLLMTYVWKTLEDAGYDPTSYAGKKLAIFAGTAASDYRQLIGNSGGDEGYVATGSVASVGPNRMSYFLDLHGPSEPIETACSSSLVALHRAVQSIKEGECHAALAGGVNTMLTPDAHINFTKAGMLSPDGHCKTFSKNANGYVRGEGVGFILLKKLSAAKRDGDRVLALVKASGVNHGGHANSLTAPNTNAQAMLLRDIYTSAGIDPHDIGYIEAHGTGTVLGDPVEINGLKSVFSDSSNEQASMASRTCFVGSVKTNIGHLELAAGIAGIIKTLLQMEHKMLVPSLHSEDLNPHIKLDGSPFKISQELSYWESFKDDKGYDLPRLAGVSSFGFGGVNAHVVLEEYIEAEHSVSEVLATENFIFVLSAKTESALLEQAKTLYKSLANHQKNNANEIAFTLQMGRAAMAHRLAIVACSVSELRNHLHLYLSGEMNEYICVGRVSELQHKNDSEIFAGDLATDVASVWVKGQVVDWQAYYKTTVRRAKLPTYSFARDIYHISLSTSGQSSMEKPYKVFDGQLEADAFYLRDHKVMGRQILPGAMSLELVRSLYTENRSFKPVILKNVGWHRTFELSQGEVKPQISFRQAAASGMNFVFEATDGAGDYMRGLIDDIHNPIELTSLDIRQIQASLPRVDVAAIYDNYLTLGIAYGPTFQVIENLYAGAGKVLAHLRLRKETAEAKELALHPAILDGAFHSALALFNEQLDENLALPIGLESLEIYHPLKPEMWALLSIRSTMNGLTKLDIDLIDLEGIVAVKIKSFTLKNQPKIKQQAAERQMHTMNLEHTASFELYLKSMLSNFTDISVENIDLGVALERYGLDSMLLTRMTEALKQDFGELPSTLFFDHLTLGSLLQYFTDNHAEKLAEFSGKRTSAQQSKIANDSVLMVNKVYGQRERQEDIAIIGLSGRYPKAENLDEFWENLVGGKDCITEIPKARWDHETLVKAAKDAKLNIKSKWGGFIENPDSFDSLFFNISPAEANYLDPQERLFMQCAWETIEDAGYTRQTLAPIEPPLGGSHVGVFVGVMWQEYQLYGAHRYANNEPPISMSGNGASVANRVSYFCNFHGPSMMVDTMCSSSLTAIHLAVESIKSGSCKVALAGGVNLTSHPNKYIGLAQANFLSSNGKCESFGQGGDGYVPSEGVGAVLLKPLKDALADRDQIYGLIRGSELNHGGQVNGYTVPNPHAQAAVISRALERANVDASQIDYVEAHGTGTILGDPIEIAALTRAYGNRDKVLGKCAIGSVKSNIGHAESAAGIAGLTKILLQFKNDQLVPSIHSDTLNPKISFEDSSFRVQRENLIWKRRQFNGSTQARIAGLSSFGAGGSNAHFVVEDYKYTEEETTHFGSYLLPFSAHDNDALSQMLSRFRNFSGRLSNNDLPAVAYTLQTGREAFDDRVVLIVKSITELQQLIDEVLSSSFERLNSEFAYYNHVLALNRPESMLSTEPTDMARAWVSGVHIDWTELWRDAQPVKMSLPTYPFARDVYWVPGMEAPSYKKATDKDKVDLPLLYSPHWLEKDISGSLIGKAVLTQLVLCHIPAEHSRQFKGLVASDDLHVWDSDKKNISGDCFKDYAANLMALLKNLTKQTTVRTNVHVIVNSEQGGSYLQGLAGMLRSASFEVAHLSTQLIEYESDSLANLLFAIPKELQQSRVHGHIRYNAYGRFEQYWSELTAIPSGQLPCKDGGVYLITGGRGGIGLHMAREIANAVNNTSLWLIGRSPNSVQQQQEIQTLKAKVNYRQLDVTSEIDVNSLIQEIHKTENRLDGVIHSAGLTRDGLLRTKTIEDLQDVLSPKVDGIINLDRAIGNTPLDFMLLMSSVAGALGNAGQTDYATANAFLDSFAAYRNRLRQQGKRQGHTLSIDWPYWRDGGIKLNDQYIEAMQRDYGVLPLEFSAALIALSTGFSDKNLDQMLVLSGDHERLRTMMAEQVIPADKPVSVASIEHSGIESSKSLDLGREAITDIVISAFAEVLSIPAGQLDKDKSVDKYGVDSVSALHILESLNKTFGELPQTILFEYPTINGLLDYLYETYTDFVEDNRFGSDDCTDEKIVADDDLKNSNEQDHDVSVWLNQTPDPWKSPMGEGQKGIWIAQLMQPESSVYNVPIAFQLKDVDEKLLARACALVLERYPILSVSVDDSSFPTPMLFAGAIFEVLVNVTMSKGLNVADFIKYRASIPFDLRKVGKVRFELLTGGKMDKSESILLVVAHHLVVDATSMVTLTEELWWAYDTLSQGKVPQVNKYSSSLDYAHYIAWETDFLKSTQGKAELVYWREKIDRDIQKLHLPSDLDDGKNRIAKPQTLECLIDSDALASAEAAARLIGVSKTSFFMGVFSILLYKYTGQGTYILGVPTMRRPERCFEKTVGYCANMLPLMVELNGQMTTDVFFRSLNTRMLADLAHGNVPYSKIVRESEIFHGGEIPYQATFCYLNIGGGAETALQFNQGKAKLVPEIRQSNDTLIGVDFFEHNNGLDAVFSYDGSYFSPEFIYGFMTHFKILLNGVMRQSSATIANQTILSPDEKNSQLECYGKESIGCSSIPVLEAIRKQVLEFPDAPAIICDNDSLSYREMMSKVNRLSNYLLSRGVRAEDNVAVLLERNMDSIITILAVMSVGAVWLPLDSESPDARKRAILQNASVRLLITQTCFDEQMAVFGLKHSHIAFLENIEPYLATISDNEPTLSIDPSSPAYIIFTSGSTGEPKGVVISQAAIAEHTNVISAKYDLRNNDVVLQFASHSTDTALEQILPTLASGGSLVMMSGKLLAAKDFYELLRDQKITVADIPPSYLREVLLAWREKEVPEYNLSLRLILVGGEALTSDLVSLWQNSILGCVKLLNAYGPTESTITTHIYEVNRDQTYGKAIPIGRPLDGIVAYILDDDGNLVPEGVKGELFLGGNRLARGYFNNQNLTAERFPLMDIGTNLGRQRLYRTGDRVSYLRASNGIILFHGRIDNQVKVRGYRVELGEIESKILGYDDCSVAVLYKSNHDGDAVLIAYIEVKADTFDKIGLKEYLRHELPEHMVPNRIIYLECLPVSTSGKIDRISLNKLEVITDTQGYSLVPPRNDLERKLMDLWRVVLDDIEGEIVASVFVPFDCYGGNSLSAVRLMHEISKALMVQLSYEDLQSASTISQQTKLVMEKTQSEAYAQNDDKNSIVPLRIARDGNGANQILFLLHPIGGEVSCYLSLTKLLPASFSVYGIRGCENEKISSVTNMAEQYFKTIKSIQPEGPYRIAGWSFGGLLAYEIAGLLVSNQDELAFVGLLDSYPYNLVKEIDGETNGQTSTQKLFETFSRDLLGLTEMGSENKLPDSFEALANQINEQKALTTIGIHNLKNMYDTFVLTDNAFRTHILSNNEIPITLFHTKNDFTERAIRQWKSLTKTDNQVYLMPGDHYSFLHQEKLASWVNWFNAELMNISTQLVH